MKKLSVFLMTIILLLSFSFGILAESIGSDYSWMDDMTINQLKELDAEIHKRIPYEGKRNIPNTTDLPGTWWSNMYGIDCFLVFHDDGSCILISSNGGVEKGTYSIMGALVTVSSSFYLLSGQWELSGDQLINNMMQLVAVKTDKPVRYISSNEGSSMEDTLGNQDVILVEYREPSELKRFDLVVVNYPGRGSTIFNKRIVGMPGDTIRMEDGYLYIQEAGQDTEFKYDEPYINDEYRSGPLNTFRSYTVPEGKYFVMGDHRNNSNDSRSIGPLSADMMLGVIIEINGLPYVNPIQ